MELFPIVVTLFFATIVFFYFAVFRPWQLRWGATDNEIQRAMPEDEVIKLPSFNATRAVTINALPEKIYPWIVQMGVTRAGWYSYDLLDNMARPSAEILLPEHQTIQIGDLIPMSPDGKDGLFVKDFRKNEWISWWNKKGDTTWVWGIYPEGTTKTRLITRVRVKYDWLSTAIIFNLLIEFFDFPMMRKCMLGIKKRAESIA